MRRFNSTKRNYVIAGLCLVLVIMAVAYSAFSSQLNISGTSSIGSNWDIEITNIETFLPSEVGLSYTDGYNTADPTYTPTAATFNAGFELPGSYIYYVVEVSNLGSIDGLVTVGNLSCGDNDAIGCYALALDEHPITATPSNQFVFGNGQQDYSDIEFVLSPRDKHYIGIEVYYKDVTSQPDNLSANISLELTYEQAVGTYLATGPIVYTYNETRKKIGRDTILGVSDYTSLSSYQEGKTTFLKYERNESNVIQKAWVCQKISILEEPVCLQGGSADYYESNLAILTELSNNETFINAGGICNLESDHPYCNLESFYISANYTSNSVETADTAPFTACIIENSRAYCADGEPE